MYTDPKTSYAAQLDRIEVTLGKMDEKLDNHLERIAVSEIKIASLQGHAKIAVSIFLAIVGFLGTALFNQVWGK